MFRQKKYTTDSGIFMTCTEVKSWVFNTYENDMENFQPEEKASETKPEATDWELFGHHVMCQEQTFNQNRRADHDSRHCIENRNIVREGENDY